MKSLEGILALLTYCNSSGVLPVESTKSSTWGDYANVLILQVKALHSVTPLRRCPDCNVAQLEYRKRNRP